VYRRRARDAAVCVHEDRLARGADASRAARIRAPGSTRRSSRWPCSYR